MVDHKVKPSQREVDHKVKPSQNQNKKSAAFCRKKHVSKKVEHKLHKGRSQTFAVDHKLKLGRSETQTTRTTTVGLPFVALDLPYGCP